MSGSDEEIIARVEADDDPASTPPYDLRDERQIRAFWSHGQSLSQGSLVRSWDQYVCALGHDSSSNLVYAVSRRADTEHLQIIHARHAVSAERSVWADLTARRKQ